MEYSFGNGGVSVLAQAHGWVARWGPSAGAFLALLAPTSAQAVRVSQIERRPFGDVVELQVTAAGSRVVYRADHDVGGRFDLYSAPVDGSAAPIRLSTEPVRAGFVLAQSGARAVFSTDDGLFSVFTDGSASPLRLDNAATDLTPTLDGTRVAYRLNGLRICPVDLAQPLTLATTADAPLKMTPDGTGLVFPVKVLDYPFDEFAFLYRVPVDGGGQTLLSGNAEWIDSDPSLPLFVVGDVSVTFLANAIGTTIENRIRSAPSDGSAGRGIDVGTDFVTTSNGRRVVYRDAAGRLVSAPTSGSGIARRSNGSPGARGKLPAVLFDALATGSGAIRITPDQRSVVFRGLQAGNVRLFVVPIDGSASPLLLSGVLNGVDDFALTSDGAKAFFTVAGSLYSVPLDLSRAAVLLAAPAAPGASVKSILSSVSSGRVAFTADHLQNGVFELFGAPIDGGAAAVRLSSSLPPGASLDQEPGQVVLSSDGTRVVYSGAQETAGVFELFSVPIDGATAPQRLSAPRPLAPYPRHVFDFAVAEGGPTAVYRANAEDEDIADLYAFGPGGRVKLNGPPSFPGFSGIVSYRLARDGSVAVFGEGVGFGIDDTPFDLFGAPTDGSTSPVRLTPVDLGALGGYLLDALGQRVVYRVLAVPDQLFSVPALGGTGVRIDGGDDPFAFAATPDATRVAFTGSNLAGYGLFVVPIDGSAPPMKVLSFSELPVFTSFVITPDGERAVVELGASTRRLVSIRLDGSQALTGTQLGPTYTPAGPGSYSISPDSSQVVFRADVGSTGRVDLYGAPIDGSTPPVRLNGVMLVNRDVTAFAISPDSTRAVYRADAITNDVFELFSVPVEGSSAPVRLNAPLPTGGDVEGFAIAPDSRVVYDADQPNHSNEELFSVPIDGTSTPVRISGPLPPASFVGAFRIAPGSQRVHFLRDRGSGFELFRTRIDGAGEPELESSLLVPGGNVLSFQLEASGTEAYYLADQEFDEAPELYLSLLRDRAHVR